MRQLFVAALAFAVVGVLQAETPQDKKAEVKGLHLCCKQCEASVSGILGKIEGVSDVKCDRKKKMVTFAVKDQKAAQAALTALAAGGFWGTATYDGTVAFSQVTETKAGKTSEVTVKGVHACCGQCVGALKAMFKDATVTVTGKGAQKDVQVTGTDLEPNAVLSALHKAGFNGTIAEKK